MDKIDEILLALRDYRSDEFRSDELGNLLVRSFFYNLGTTNNLADITKEEFLEGDFIDEVFAARDRLRELGRQVNIEVGITFRIS